MKLIESITNSNWAAAFRHVHCAKRGCPRWLTQRHLSVRKVGVHLGASWYCSYRCVASALQGKLMQLMSPVSGTSQPAKRMPLGLMLVSRGKLTKEQLQLANERQRQTRRDMGDVLIELGFVNEKQVTSARSALWQCPVFEPPVTARASGVSIPTTLMRQHSVVPIHNTSSADKVLVAFRDRINYGLLYAIEQMTGCKTTPCFVTPSDHSQWMESQPPSPDEVLVDTAISPEEMTRVVCRQGARMDANDIALVRCGDRIWVRLKDGKRAADLLFQAA